MEEGLLVLQGSPGYQVSSSQKKCKGFKPTLCRWTQSSLVGVTQLPAPGEVCPPGGLLGRSSTGVILGSVLEASELHITSTEPRFLQTLQG